MGAGFRSFGSVSVSIHPGAPDAPGQELTIGRDNARTASLSGEILDYQRVISRRTGLRLDNSANVIRGGVEESHGMRAVG